MQYYDAIDTPLWSAGLPKPEFSSLQPRMVQWFPGHIAKAERQLKTQLSRVDVILEIRDAR